MTPTIGDVPQSIADDITGYFVENLGQKGTGGGRYYIEGHPMSAAFGDGWVTYTLAGGPDDGSYAYQMSFVGSNDVQPEGMDSLEHSSNYLIGGRSGWVQGARNYRQVYYTDLWDGIDLRFHVDKGMLKYDLVVCPGASVENIRFDYVGVDGVETEVETGNLMIHTPKSSIREEAPLAWQVQGTECVYVDASFTLSGTAVGYTVGAYDADITLIIDPGIKYSTYVGAGESGNFWQSTVDSEGAVYCTGLAWTGEFPTTPGAYDRAFNGSQDVFVLKMSSDLSGLVYSTFIGGTDREYGKAIDVDAEGNAHITGITISSDFPTTVDAWRTEKHGGYDAFFLKLDASGSSLLYSTFIAGYHMGGAGEEGRALKVDEDGLTYVAGSVSDRSFPTTPGAYNDSVTGQADIWVMKFNTSNASLVFSAHIGGSGYDFVSALFVDSEGSVTLTASTTSPDFPTTEGAFQRVHGGGIRDWVVFRLDDTASTILFSTYIGGVGWDWPIDLAVDEGGNTYVCGFTDSSDFPTTPGAYQTGCSGGNEIAVCKLNANASTLLNSTLVGGSYQDDPNGIVLGPGGYVHVTGKTWSIDFPITAPSPSPGDERDAVLLTLDKDLGDLVMSVRIGGNATEGVYDGLHLDDAGLLTFVGRTESDDLNITPEAYCSTLVGDIDLFLLKYQIDVHPPEIRAVLGENATTGDRLEVTAYLFDCTNVSSASIEYWYDDSVEHAFSSMSLNSGTAGDGLWKGLIEIPGNSVQPLSVRIHAEDVLGFRNATDVETVPVLDNDRPALVVDDIIDTATTGDPLWISVRVLDNIGVDGAKLYWYYGDDPLETQNVSLLPEDDVDAWGNGTYAQQFVVDPYTLDALHIALEAIDTSGNVNRTSWYEITILDNDGPSFGEDSTPGEATTGDPLTFAVEVHDNIGVQAVWVEYRYGTASVVNVSLAASGGGVWNATETLFHTLTALRYRFGTEDAAGNVNRTSWRNITISDNDPPEIVTDPTLGVATTGDPFTFFVSVQDNIAVFSVSVVYSLAGGADVLLSLDLVDTPLESPYDFATVITVPADARGVIVYHFLVQDFPGNVLRGPDQSVVILDDDAPTISYEHRIDEALKGIVLELDVEVQDNIGVESVYIVFRFGDGAVENVSVGSARPVKMLVPRHPDGDLRFHLSAVDGAGNWCTTAEFMTTLVNAVPMLVDLTAWEVTEGTDAQLNLGPHIVDPNDEAFAVSCDDDSVQVEGLLLRLRHDVAVPDRTVVLTISDGEGAGMVSLTIHVMNVNDAPVIISVEPANGSRFKKGERVTFRANATDEDGDELAYTWYLGERMLGEGRELDYGGLGTGEQTVRLVVSDGNATAEARVVVEITRAEESSSWVLLLVGILVVVAFIVAVVMLRKRRAPES